MAINLTTIALLPPWKTPFVEPRTGMVTQPWVLYIQALQALASNTGSSGHTTVNTKITVGASGGEPAYQIYDSLNQRINSLMTNPAAAMAAQALEGLNTANLATGNLATTALSYAYLANNEALAAYRLAQTANSTANQAYGQANLAYTQANTALAYVYLANTEAIAAFTLATTANATANLAYGQANAAYSQANLAYTAANTALAIGFLANIEAVAAWNIATYANTLVSNITAANASNLSVVYSSNGISLDTRVPSGGGGGNYQADVYANGTLVLANATLNFNNTATTNVNVTANGTQANINVSVNTTLPTLAFATATLAYSQANAALSAAAGVLANIASGNPSNVAVTLEANGQLQVDTRISPNLLAYSAVDATNSNVALGSLVATTAFTYYNIANISRALITSLQVQANLPGSDWSLCVRGAPNDNGTLFLMANSIGSNTYNISYPWAYLPDNFATGDANLYIGIINYLPQNTQYTLNYIHAWRFTSNPPTATASLIDTEQFTATANQTVFTLSNPVTPGNTYLVVSRNGLVQAPNTDYALNVNTNVLTLTSNCDLGDFIEVREFIGVTVVSADISSAIYTQANNAYAQANNGPKSFLVAANGYVTDGIGRTQQWGKFSKTASATGVVVNFPHAFANACYSVVLTTEENGTIPGFEQMLVATPNLTAFVVSGAAFGVSPPDATINVNWQAVGS